MQLLSKPPALVRNTYIRIWDEEPIGERGGPSDGLVPALYGVIAPQLTVRWGGPRPTVHFRHRSATVCAGSAVERALARRHDKGKCRVSVQKCACRFGRKEGVLGVTVPSCLSRSDGFTGTVVGPATISQPPRVPFLPFFFCLFLIAMLCGGLSCSRDASSLPFEFILWIMNGRGIAGESCSLRGHHADLDGACFVRRSRGASLCSSSLYLHRTLEYHDILGYTLSEVAEYRVSQFRIPNRGISMKFVGSGTVFAPS